MRENSKLFWIRFFDFLFLVCASGAFVYRNFFPKNYPPLDRFFIPLVLLVVIELVLMKKLKTYENCDNKITINAVRVLILLIPMLLSLIMTIKV